MNTEQLIQLGLTEEQANAVSTALEAQQMIPKARFDEVNNAKKALESQVADYDTQLKTLQDSAKGNESLQAEIKALQEANSQVQAKYEQDLKDAKVNAAIQLALAGKVHDTDLVTSLFDRSSIELGEDGKIKGGLEEQLTALKESKTFLFVPESSPQQVPTFNPVGVAPAGINPDPAPNVSLGSQWAQQMNATTNTKPQTSVWGQ